MFDVKNMKEYHKLFDEAPIAFTIIEVLRGETPRLYLGAIAEDVEALGVPGLTTYDADGTLNGVAYERMALALLPWLADLDHRLREAGL